MLYSFSFVEFNLHKLNSTKEKPLFILKSVKEENKTRVIEQGTQRKCKNTM